MSKTTRVVLIVLGSLFVFAVVVVAAGAFWWSRSGSALMEASQEAIAEGEAFGSSTDDETCLQESLERHDRCDGFGCQMANNVFLTECLKNSAATEGFCADVPTSDSVMASGTWLVEQCSARGRSGNYCNQLFAQVRAYCMERQ